MRRSPFEAPEQSWAEFGAATRTPPGWTQTCVTSTSTSTSAEMTSFCAQSAEEVKGCHEPPYDGGGGRAEEREEALAWAPRSRASGAHAHATSRPVLSTEISATPPFPLVFSSLSDVRRPAALPRGRC